MYVLLYTHACIHKRRTMGRKNIFIYTESKQLAVHKVFTNVKKNDQVKFYTLDHYV